MHVYVDNCSFTCKMFNQIKFKDDILKIVTDDKENQEIREGDVVMADSLGELQQGAVRHGGGGESEAQGSAQITNSLTENSQQISVYNTCTLLLNNKKYNADANLDTSDTAIFGNKPSSE